MVLHNNVRHMDTNIKASRGLGTCVEMVIFFSKPNKFDPGSQALIGEKSISQGSH